MAERDKIKGGLGPGNRYGVEIKLGQIWHLDELQAGEFLVLWNDVTLNRKLR